MTSTPRMKRANGKMPASAMIAARAGAVRFGRVGGLAVVRHRDKLTRRATASEAAARDCS